MEINSYAEQNPSNGLGLAKGVRIEKKATTMIVFAFLNAMRKMIIHSEILHSYVKVGILNVDFNLDSIFSI